ncbi:hypothetical protein DPMN_114899 [Dreissena polymorpha]|uniref:CCHC-type domain-containing protein n=1 Tax=Dreissena polymorpha TaxID=45954 RepID=A0A9D4KLU8_DREPO|nr:hypothetical protein DPMN_114899 [Dreissena polymorpha]
MLKYRTLILCSGWRSILEAKELPATAQGRFQVAHQASGESLEDWSDRVLTLATKVFRDLPSKYATEQAVAKFCKGLSNKEAGKHVSLQVPTSMGDAMNKIKMHSYVFAACASLPRDGAKVKPEDSKRVHAVNTEPNPVSVDGSTVGRLVQAVERLEGAIGHLSGAGGNSGVDPRSQQLGQPPRKGGYNDSPYQGNVPNRGFNGQHQGRYGYAEGRGAGGPPSYPNQYNRYSNRNANPVDAQRGGYGANRGRYADQPVANRGSRPGYAPPPGPGRRGGGRQDLMCFRCRGLCHFQRECPSPPSKRGRYGSNWGHFHAMSLPSHERGSGPNAYDGSSGSRRCNRYHSGYQNSNYRPEGSKRGRFGSNWGEGHGIARRDISCLNCGRLGHFQRACLENTKVCGQP